MSGRLLSRAERNRGRESAAASSRTPQAQRRRRNETPSATELPEYEPPSCPLSRDARQALAELSTNSADTREYEAQLKKSVALLTTSVRDINDRYVQRKDTLKRLRQRRQGQSASQGEDGEDGSGGDKRSAREKDEEAALKRLREKVPGLTEECDFAVQQVIDYRVALDDNREAITNTMRKVEEECSAVIAAAAANRVEHHSDSEGEDDDDDMNGSPTPKAAKNNSPQPMPDIKGPLRILKREKQTLSEVYNSKSLTQKYAQDNDYIGFKRMWWDAVHGEDGKPLPDASRWFNSGGNDDEEEEDDDEDLVIAQEHVSIYCPLTLVVMSQPYTSKTCKHTFEKSAIVDYLRTQSGGRGTCPVPGCNEQVTIQDFADDPVMIRKIKREQQAQEARDDEDEEQDDEKDNDDEEEDGDGDGDVSMNAPPPARGIKAERARDRGRELLASVGLARSGQDADEDDDMTMREEDDD
ncbi:hypothetical protein F5Y16DRAFT_374026 [Xylariaceae sp. FL0255]|nr:hypothetical protein F5Y16DRAFT_374026 [Xylariaceae sp. FL0255]